VPGFGLDACSDPEVQRIALVDAPAVLGWTRWTEIENRYNIGMMRALLSNAVETGRIPPQPIGATALTILGAMREATLYVALAEDHDLALEEAGLVINRLITRPSVSNDFSESYFRASNPAAAAIRGHRGRRDGG
jgi:Tetracyclin repressor-like, C-terminal domain